MKVCNTQVIFTNGKYYYDAELIENEGKKWIVPMTFKEKKILSFAIRGGFEYNFFKQQITIPDMNSKVWMNPKIYRKLSNSKIFFRWLINCLNHEYLHFILHKFINANVSVKMDFLKDKSLIDDGCH